MSVQTAGVTCVMFKTHVYYFKHVNQVKVTVFVARPFANGQSGISAHGEYKKKIAAMCVLLKLKSHHNTSNIA